MVTKFNMIDFHFSNKPIYEQHRHCSIHVGTRLLKAKDDPNLLLCPECGCEYLLNETSVDQNIQSKFSPNNSGTKIISGKKKRKYYDVLGHEITDPEILAEAQRGKTVISYNEQKSGEEYHTVKK
jgi:hypothetical protein